MWREQRGGKRSEEGASGHSPGSEVGGGGRVAKEISLPKAGRTRGMVTWMPGEKSTSWRCMLWKSHVS